MADMLDYQKKEFERHKETSSSLHEMYANGELEYDDMFQGIQDTFVRYAGLWWCFSPTLGLWYYHSTSANVWIESDPFTF